MNTILDRRSFRRLCALFLCALLLAAALPGTHAFADNEQAVPAYVPPAELGDYQARNGDVIALLNIPGTGTCYPILQHPTEEDYYLNLTIDGDEGYPGSIYTNPVEGQDFATFNTVIYGHNMRDGSYFGNLKSFRDPEYLAAHREIDIYTPEEKHVYDIFAVVIYSDLNIADGFNDGIPAAREAFLASLKNGLEGSILLDDVEVGAESRIITLSTCIADMHDNRLIIVAAERDAEPPVDPVVAPTYTPPAEPDPYADDLL